MQDDVDEKEFVHDEEAELDEGGGLPLLFFTVGTWGLRPQRGFGGYGGFGLRRGFGLSGNAA